MRRISVGLVLHVDDDIAARYETLHAYLEAHLLDGDVRGSIRTIEDITDRVEAQLEKMRHRRWGERP